MCCGVASSVSTSVSRDKSAGLNWGCIISSRICLSCRSITAFCRQARLHIRLQACGNAWRKEYLLPKKVPSLSRGEVALLRGWINWSQNTVRQQVKRRCELVYIPESQSWVPVMLFELSKKMFVLLLSLYENSSIWWILMQAEQRNGEFIAQLEDRGRPLR